MPTPHHPNPTDFAATQPIGLAAQATIVFVDLCGSTGMYENLGNDRATKAVTKITRWMCHTCEMHGGRVIKTLGDGVLMRFERSSDALYVCIELQRRHEERIRHWPEAVRAQLQMGLASGEVMDVEGDCFGDAVNVAARLSGMSGAAQIWANDVAMASLPAGHSIRYRALGPMMVRGKAEPLELYQVEWAEQFHSSILTVQGQLPMQQGADSVLGGIDLSWLDVNSHFRAEEGAIVIGRDQTAHFIVQDNRVSRQHVRIEWQTTPSGGHFVLLDLSSFGTWVRFKGSQQEVELRRGRCTLSSDGEIGLGAPFSDFTVPTVMFSLSASGVAIRKKRV